MDSSLEEVLQNIDTQLETITISAIVTFCCDLLCSATNINHTTVAEKFKNFEKFNSVHDFIILTSKLTDHIFLVEQLCDHIHPEYYAKQNCYIGKMMPQIVYKMEHDSFISQYYEKILKNYDRIVDNRNEQICQHFLHGVPNSNSIPDVRVYDLRDSSYLQVKIVEFFNKENHKTTKIQVNFRQLIQQVMLKNITEGTVNTCRNILELYAHCNGYTQKYRTG